VAAWVVGMCDSPLFQAMILDIASWSARALRGLFLDDNDNNHQNFRVSCNNERCDEKVDEGSKSQSRSLGARFGLRLVAISVTSAGLVLI
jgi:hypothetical protein